MTHTMLTTTDWTLLRLAPGVALMIIFALLAWVGNALSRGVRAARKAWLGHAPGFPQRR
jgi:hypothetical protein